MTSWTIPVNSICTSVSRVSPSLRSNASISNASLFRSRDMSHLGLSNRHIKYVLLVSGCNWMARFPTFRVLQKGLVIRNHLALSEVQWVSYPIVRACEIEHTDSKTYCQDMFPCRWNVPYAIQEDTQKPVVTPSWYSVMTRPRFWGLAISLWSSTIPGVFSPGPSRLHSWLDLHKGTDMPNMLRIVVSITHRLH